MKDDGGLIRVVLAAIGFFGSIIVGIISYFLSSLIKEQKEINGRLNETVRKLEIDMTKVMKDIHYIRTTRKLFSNIRKIRRP